MSKPWVFVSNTPFSASDTPTTLSVRVGVWSSHQTSAPGPSSAISVGAAGQYVRVQLADADYLQLAEVQVFGTPLVNLGGKTGHAKQHLDLAGTRRGWEHGRQFR